MALEPGDFIQPTGELAAGLFPGENLETLVTAWLADAANRAEDDEERQRAWVLHRAYATVADRFHAGLASESKGPVSAARSDEQFRYWSQKAAYHLRRYAGSGSFRPVF